MGQKGLVWEYVECVVIALILAFLIITFVVQSFVVDGASMEPTLHDGQRLLVNKFLYYFTSPQKGDVVVFRYPANPRTDFIKRIIASGGDTIEIRDGKVILNGDICQEDYILELTYGQFGPIEIPTDRFFVLGDNRNNSKDSRYPDVGLLKKREIIGKASLIYWPLSNSGFVNSKRK